jgi:hypothetical protein
LHRLHPDFLSLDSSLSTCSNEEGQYRYASKYSTKPECPYRTEALPRRRPASLPLRLLRIADDPGVYPTAIIFENRSDKEITALRYCWSVRDRNGKTRSHTITNDSYKVDVYRPVVLPQSKQLLSVSGRLDVNQSLYNHVLAGGGAIGAGGSAGERFSDAAEEITFQIELVVFSNGEIAGPDPGHYAAELQGRKRAAEYVAKHVRLAMLEERDPTPVVAALRDMPHLRTDPLAHLVCEYVRGFLRHSSMRGGPVDWAEAALKHLENRPTLPKFYRIDPSESPP